MCGFSRGGGGEGGGGLFKERDAPGLVYVDGDGIALHTMQATDKPHLMFS